MSENSQELPKPRELLAARAAAEALFTTLRSWFDVPGHVTIDLRAVDSAVGELSDPQFVMAMAMRKLQALHLLTTPGVITTTDVVLTVIQDLERALLQAPAMHLRNAAAETDWDAALAELDEDGPQGDAPSSADQNAFDRSDRPDGEAEAEDPVADLAGGVAWDQSNEPVSAGEGGATDDEIEAFRQHHAALHEAARAVLRASDGEIRRLI